MALSDQLMDLAGRTKRLEDAAAAAGAKDVTRMEQQRAQLRAKAGEARGNVEAWWTETTAKVEQQRAELKAKREQRETELDVEAAKEYADIAEAFAASLNALAAFATDAAAEATVDAGIARQQAESGAKTPVAS